MRPTVVLLAGVALIGVQQANAALPTTCQGRPVTLSGSDFDANLQGTSQHDVIHRGAGNNVIRGNGGNDVICGGKGRRQHRGRRWRRSDSVGVGRGHPRGQSRP